MKFKKIETEIQDLVIIEPIVFEDSRGFFQKATTIMILKKCEKDKKNKTFLEYKKENKIDQEKI